MLKAVHKPTGEIVWAWRVENDASWIGRQNDEWTAPRYMVYDYQDKGDIKVFFTKTHIRDGTQVRSHFKHEAHREIYDKESESIEHKLAKEGIYESICNGDIKLEGKPIKDLLLDIQFEFPLSNHPKAKIADVLAIFKEWHPLYGKGIVFEVQFSNQINEITEARTFNRISEGYSVCWLWDANFINCKLRADKEIQIIPFLKAIEEYQKRIEEKSINKINAAGLLLDKKIHQVRDIDETVEKVVIDLKDIIEDEKKKMREEISFLRKSFDIEEINRELNKKKDNFYKGVLEQIELLNKIKLDKKEDIIKQIKEMDLTKIKEEFVSGLKEEVLKYFKEHEKELIKIDSVACVKCFSCKKMVSTKEAEYENGSAYCPECFNSLKDNWRKRYLNNEVKREHDRNKIN